MSEYDDTNRGAMFKNDKGDNPKRPDYRGFLNVNGTEFWLSGWVREAQQGKHAGEKFLSVAIEAKEDRPKQDNPLPPLDSDDDNLPF